MRAALLQRKCACGGTPSPSGECEACRRKRESAAAPPLVHEVLRSSGHRLDQGTRALLEPRFGRDFSGVRIHTDGKAAASARAVQAHAYTVGQDVVFGAGQYAPQTSAGRHLLAHELAHTIQQSEGQAGTDHPHLSALDLVHEREADSAAATLVSPASRIVPLIQRKTWTDLPVNEERPEVKRKCPSTHTIADDVYDAIGAAWAKSGHGGTTVTEQGGRIVTDKSGKHLIRTGAGGGGSISLPAEAAGDVTEGTFHTHPYSKAEGSELGVAFSGGDIQNFVNGGQGSVKYIGAGSCYFALDTQDAALRDACKSEDLKKRWNDAYAKASGSMSAQVEISVKAAIAGCGLCFYKACRPNVKAAVPKQAILV